MKALFEDDPYYRVMQLIDAVHIKSRKYAESQIRPLNMTYPQFAALMVLHIEDGVRQRRLAELLETDTTTVTVLCDSLEKRGWIKRIRDESDRRLKKITLTEEGRSIYAEASKKLHSGLSYMHDKTPVGEIRKVMPFIEELHENIKTLLEGKTE
ncbi:MarR family winged helix-turn-helix transcriptional regulator [Chloroflexota bacterium]